MGSQLGQESWLEAYKQHAVPAGKSVAAFAFSTPLVGSLLAFPLLMSLPFNTLPSILVTGPWMKLKGPCTSLSKLVCLVHFTSKTLSWLHPPIPAAVVLVKCTVAIYRHYYNCPFTELLPLVWCRPIQQYRILRVPSLQITPHSCPSRP